MAGTAYQTQRAQQTVPHKTANQVYLAIMQELREGLYAPGSQLSNERQLADRHATSRQRVRDALLIMQEAGLVERKVGSGTYLSEDAPQIIERLDADVDITASHDHSFLETIEARLIFEPGVAALAARNITPSRAAVLKDALNAVLQPGSWLDYKSRLYLFSRACYVASGNSFLLRTFDQILKARQDHKFDGHRENGAVAEIVRRHAYEQLSEIYAAIAKGDEAAAELVTRNYLVRIAASSGLT
jgi:DNA-binding FadR family transcriptional regulator